MNSDVIASVATITGGAVVAFFNYVFSAKLQNTKRDILLSQLRSLYAPLDELFVLDSEAPDKAEIVHRLVHEHYELIPPELLNEWLRFQKTQDDKAMESFAKITAVYFELARKELGYPYNRKRIDPSVIPKEPINKDMADFGLSMLILLMVFAAFNVVLNLLGKNIFPRPVVLVLHAVFFCGAYLIVYRGILLLFALIHQKAYRGRKKKPPPKSK